jgi:hypothetical protein
MPAAASAVAPNIFLVTHLQRGELCSVIVTGAESRQHAFSVFLRAYPEANPISAVSMADMEQGMQLLTTANRTKLREVEGVPVISTDR